MRCGSNPVSAGGKAMCSTFFCAAAGSAAHAKMSAAAAMARKRAILVDIPGPAREVDVDVLVLAVRHHPERRVGGDKARHVLVDGGALGAGRQRARLQVQCVELRELEA